MTKIAMKWRTNMSEEEKEAIKRIRNEVYSTAEGLEMLEITFYPRGIEDIKTILNLTQKQQKELEKLKSKNKELLKKLRNRVKEVKKLTKYSLYKKEFTKLNSEIEKKDKIIDNMAKQLYIEGYCKEINCKKCEAKNFVNCIKQYFERKVENKQC